MMKNNFGIIINVSSGAGKVGFEDISAANGGSQCGDCGSVGSCMLLRHRMYESPYT